MFGASIIVFRESLEAALLIGIIAASTRGLPRRDRWLALGIGAGLAGSLLVAAATQSIANLADGSGQELFNAAILGVAVLMIGWHNVWMASHGKQMAGKAKQVGADIRSGRQAVGDRGGGGTGGVARGLGKRAVPGGGERRRHR